MKEILKTALLCAAALTLSGCTLLKSVDFAAVTLKIGSKIVSCFCGSSEGETSEKNQTSPSQD